jgi:hydroxymethylpyrimidine pyrophosphatase-like HAD family hydrolase
MDADLIKIREEKFKYVLTQTFSGCLFDIDGTLTIRGEEYIPAFAHETLAKLAMKMPVAVCTGRSLHHSQEALMSVFTRATDPKYCQANWVMICENGGVGYYFDPTSNGYSELFRIQYPYSDDIKIKIFNKLKSALEGKAGASIMNEISMSFKPLHHSSGTPEEVSAECNIIEEIMIDTLLMIDPKRALRAGNSGSGVDVYPYNGDKENGTIEFAKYLREKRGMNIGEFAGELIVVGDQPQPEGNDESFLSGKYGTPFTVGHLHPTNVDPLPVYDSPCGKILTGPEGTISLINQLTFRS